MKHTYSVESFFLGSWRQLFSDTRDFCAGYLSHAQYENPRPALRIVRSDGKIIHSLKEDSEVCVGMVASYPTAEQYEEAARRALEKAARIRAFEAKQEERRFNRIAATHPDDGWVNRANNTIHLCYPHIMADVLKPGSIIALGDSESYRLVRLTKFTRWITAIKPTDGTWSFEPHS